MANVATGLMNGLRRFFSANGLTSVPRFGVVAVICGALLWLCSQIDYTRGQFINIVAGLVAGAAVGKWSVEGVRRLRDAGFDPTIVGRVLAVIGVVFAIVLAVRPAWINTGTEVLGYGTLVIATIVLLWPARRQVEADISHDWRGLAFATACVVVGMVVVGGIAWISIGMAAESKKRIAADVAAHANERIER